MGSNIDPDSVFLTSRPSDFLQPLDPSILTQPVWINVFLTPGASFLTSAPVTPLPTNTPLATNTVIPSTVISPTTTGIIPSPTNTVIYFPPPPTNTPKPPSTNTPVPPALSADLSITKDDGVTTYIPGGSLTYTIVVSNTSGPNAVTGATVTDTFPASTTNITWICAPTGSASCTANGTGNINDTINLAVGSSVTYTVDVDILSSASGDLINTATVTVPVGVTDPTPGNNSAIDTDTMNQSADLSITITDNTLYYQAGDIKLLPGTPPYAYTITVSNAGPSNVTGATVTNVFSNGNIDPTTIVWGCDPLSACTPSGNIGNNINTLVNVNSGSSVTIYLAVQVIASPSGNLVNDVTVTAPSGVTDPPGNNSATDSDTLVSNTYGNIGPGYDGNITILPNGSSIVLALSPAAVVNGDLGVWDIVYYEQAVTTPSGIDMDRIILEIGDGTTWYTILNWGDGNSDVASSIAIPLGPPNSTTCIGEPDNCNINPSFLDLGTGVQIDLDHPSLGIPAGSYPFIRITVPVGSGTSGIDGIRTIVP